MPLSWHPLACGPLGKLQVVLAANRIGNIMDHIVVLAVLAPRSDNCQPAGLHCSARNFPSSYDSVAGKTKLSAV